MSEQQPQRVPPHQQATLKDLTPDELYNTYQDLQLELLNEVEPSPQALVLHMSPSFQAAGHMITALTPYTCAFASAHDLLDFLSILLVPTTPPASQSLQASYRALIEEVHLEVEARRHTCQGLTALQGLVATLNTKLTGLIECTLMSYEAHQADDDADELVGCFESRWGA